MFKIIKLKNLIKTVMPTGNRQPSQLLGSTLLRERHKPRGIKVGAGANDFIVLEALFMTRLPMTHLFFLLHEAQ